MSDTFNDNNLDNLLNTHFAGRVVRKERTQRVKEGASVTVYVLECPVGMYCASDDQGLITKDLKYAQTILADSYLRPQEAKHVKSLVQKMRCFSGAARQGSRHRA